jgi:hypothetical protein
MFIDLNETHINLLARKNEEHKLHHGQIDMRPKMSIYLGIILFALLRNLKAEKEMIGRAIVKFYGKKDDHLLDLAWGLVEKWNNYGELKTFAN